MQKFKWNKVLATVKQITTIGGTKFYRFEEISHLQLKQISKTSGIKIEHSQSKTRIQEEKIPCEVKQNLADLKQITTVKGNKSWTIILDHI